MRHAHYEMVESECNAEQVVIFDLGPHTIFPTVTNDVNFVVNQLLARGRLFVGQRLFYYDSEGDRDEILFNESGFVDFAPVVIR